MLEIGYQRNYNPMYQAAYDGIVKTGMLGDIYHVRLAWHRNGSWRRKGEPPSPDYDPSKWGYPTFDHLYQLAAVLEILARADGGAVQPSGERRQLVPGVRSGGGDGLGRPVPFPEGREVYDHVYVTFEYPGGRTAVFSSIESNAFDDYYEMYFGTKGTLIMLREREALLFEEGGGGGQTGVEVTPAGTGAVAQSSETWRPTRIRPAPERRRRRQGRRHRPTSRRRGFRCSGSARRFASARRSRAGPTRPSAPPRACIGANEAIKTKARVTL